MSNAKTDISKKIALILNKAENTDNEDERDTFFVAAQKMATRAEIDLDVLRYENREEENKKHNKVEIRRVEMGQKGDRGAGAYSDLYVEIARVNEIRCIWNNSEVDAYGFPFDLDHTEALFNVVVGQMVADCIKYLDSDEWRGYAKNKNDARKSFYEGYRNRIVLRLKKAKKEAEADAEEEYAEKGVSTSLVLADKKRKVESVYWKDAYKYGYNRKARGTSAEARRAGDQAGKSARISSSSEISGRGQIAG